MFCEISVNQHQEFFETITKDLFFKIDNKDAIKDLKSYMKETYEFLLERSKDEEGNVDQVWTLTLLNTVPKHLDIIKALDEDVRGFLNKKTKNDIETFIENFKNLDVETRYAKLLNYIGKKKIDPIKLASLELNHAYGERAKEEVNYFDIDAEIFSYIIKKPITPYSSTGYESGIDQDGYYSNIPDAESAFYYNIIREVIKAGLDTAGIDFNSLSYRNEYTDGFKLVAKRTESLPIDQLYPSTQRLLKGEGSIIETVKSEYKNRKTGKIAKLEKGQNPVDNQEDIEYKKIKTPISKEEFTKKYYPGVVLVLSNKNGEPLYFDSEGNITNENEGKLVYLNLRKVYTTSTGEKKVYSLLDVNSFIEGKKSELIDSKKYNKAEFEQFAEKLRERIKLQIKNIELIRNYLMENPDESIDLDIISGRLGTYDRLFTPASKFELTDAEIESINVSTAKTAQTELGRPYIKLDDVGELVEMKAPKIKDIPNLLDNIASILSKKLNFEGDPIANSFRFSYVKQFLANKDGKFNLTHDELTNQINLFINNKNIDLPTEESTEEEVEEIYKNIKSELEKLDPYLSVNKDYTGNKTFEYANITNNNITLDTSITYKKWLLNYLKINAVPASNGRVYSLNPYFIFDIGARSLSKIDPINAGQYTTMGDKKDSWQQGNDSENPLECYG
jgi:hypothetical protein